jgi:SAM-dependent methyltransferase
MLATGAWEPAATHSGYRSVNEELVSASDIRPEQVVLDVGCGTGSASGIVVERVPRALVWAIDPDREMLEQMPGALAQRVGQIVASAEELGTLFPPAVADRVLLANCIHLIEDLPAAMRGVAKVLRPGGAVGLCTTFYEGGRPAGDEAIYRRFLFKAYAELRRRGVPRVRVARDVHSARVVDRADVRELLGTHGLVIQREWEREVLLSSDLLRDLLGSKHYAAGALPGIDPATAAAALADASQALLSEGVESIARNWWYLLCNMEAGG